MNNLKSISQYIKEYYSDDDPFREENDDFIIHNNNERERIPVRDIYEYSCVEEPNDDFNFIEQKQIYFDTEKKYVEIECIVQRIEDEKYFKFTYSDWGQGNNDLKHQTAVEVKRYERVSYYYE